MKSHYIIVSSLLACAGLASCSVREASPYMNKTGELSLNVTEDKPKTKAVSQVSDFPVDIFDAQGNAVAHYETVSLVPQKVVLDVGTYSVESHTPGTLNRRMNDPYFGGKKQVEIIAGNTTQANVVCTMQNTKISMVYGGDFFTVFKSWAITLDDGTDTALSFSDQDNVSGGQVVCYWYFVNETDAVTLNFTGYTRDGNNRISQKFIIKKSQSETGYQDDKTYFTGGDALVFTFTPEDATTGKIESISIQAEILFSETEETVIVDVEDVPTYDPGEDDPGTDPDTPPATNPIKLTLPEPITLEMQGLTCVTDPALGDVKIEAQNGIKTLMVKVESSSEDMVNSLQAVAEEYGLDLLSGSDAVGNTTLVEFLGSLGKEITVPQQGDKEYTFPVGQFFGFLGILPGEHNFIMTVTDLQGNTNSGTIKITVPAM